MNDTRAQRMRHVATGIALAGLLGGIGAAAAQSLSADRRHSRAHSPLHQHAIDGRAQRQPLVHAVAIAIGGGERGGASMVVKLPMSGQDATGYPLESAASLSQLVAGATPSDTRT